MTKMQNHEDSLGFQHPERIADYLDLIGDHEAADRFRSAGASGQGLGSLTGSDVYAFTGLVLGFIEPYSATTSSGASHPIVSASTMDADLNLKDSRIKITFDQFFVQNYPGLGQHKILCEFSGKNQIAGEAEELKFALTATARDGASSSVQGAPIFLGASVGRNGISFEGTTINVSSSTDDALLAALDTDSMRSGLSLLTSAQPALKPFVGLAGSVVKAVASRSKNKQIFSFKLGLDFESGVTSARLRIGSYVVVQVDPKHWSWETFEWDSNSQIIRNKVSGEVLPFNYLVFGVAAFNADASSSL